MALAIGCTVRELQDRLTPEEVEDWHRFFMIFGPVGDRRLDENFAWLRQLVRSFSEPTTIEECRLKYDYRDHFPKDAATELERMVENADADIAKVMAMGKRMQENR